MYSVHLIDSNGKGSYLSVRGRAAWKSKYSAIAHAKDIANCKVRPWDAQIVEVVDDNGRVVWWVYT